MRAARRSALRLGYAPGFPPVGDIALPWFAGSDDGRRLAAMPAELRQGLADYYAAVDRGDVADRSLAHRPCLWLDAHTRCSLQYEWRPEVCRTFRPGSPVSVSHRRAVGLPTG